MEAILGLFLIVAVFALLSGAGRSRTDNEGPAVRREGGASAGARPAPTTRESESSSILPALILLLAVAALLFNAG